MKPTKRSYWIEWNQFGKAFFRWFLFAVFWIIIPPLVIFFLSDFSGFQLFSLFLPCMEHIEKMKEIISEQEIKKFNYYGSIYTVHLAVLIISAVPLFMWLGRYAYIPFGILFIMGQSFFSWDWRYHVIGFLSRPPALTWTSGNA